MSIQESKKMPVLCQNFPCPSISDILRISDVENDLGLDDGYLDGINKIKW